MTLWLTTLPASDGQKQDARRAEMSSCAASSSFRVLRFFGLLGYLMAIGSLAWDLTR